MVEADIHHKLLPTSILDIYSILEYIHAVHRHRVAALHSYTHTSWPGIWPSGSVVESKTCHYIMEVAESQLKLLSTSILDMCRVFEHIYMLSIGTE
jgi:hypothetical protein